MFVSVEKKKDGTNGDLELSVGYRRLRYGFGERDKSVEGFITIISRGSDDK
jgi:hypothetical protein